CDLRQPYGAGGAFQRVQETKDLGEKLAIARVRAEPANRSLRAIEMLLGLGAKKPPEERLLLFVEIGGHVTSPRRGDRARRRGSTWLRPTCPAFRCRDVSAHPGAPPRCLRAIARARRARLAPRRRRCPRRRRARRSRLASRTPARRSRARRRRC